MSRDLHDEPMTPADFEALFADEPAGTDPVADLRRGRRRRHRRRLGEGAVGLVTVVAVGGAFGPTLLDRVASGPVGVPSPAPSSSTQTPDPSTTPSPAPPSPARDTAPALRRNGHGSYLDANGRTLGFVTGPGQPSPFQATTKNSWALAVEHLDPERQHLGAYESDALTGGVPDGGGLQIGQKIGWTVHGDPGEGVVQLAVIRPEPGEHPRLGPGHADSEGFCAEIDTACRRTTVAGIEVDLAKTSDGGFVMDRLQEDGEVASITVSPVFGNNTDVALRTMHVTLAQAAALLDDPALDVVG